MGDFICMANQPTHPLTGKGNFPLSFLNKGLFSNRAGCYYRGKPNGFFISPDHKALFLGGVTLGVG